jgi:energy-coupling factor transporter ATP-binding protein EcfA2
MPSEPTRSVFALRETPLVGRLGELARIKTLAAAACRKQRGAAGLLLGEAGMGKSSLLRAAREALEQSGAMQVWSLASEQHETSGRAALVAALTTALGLQTTQRSDWLDHLCDLFPERDRHAWCSLLHRIGPAAHFPLWGVTRHRPYTAQRVPRPS